MLNCRRTSLIFNERRSNARSVKINFSFQATDSSGIPNRSTARIENTYECTSPGISEPPIFLYANGVQTTH